MLSTRTMFAGLLVALSCRPAFAQVPDTDQVIAETLKDMHGEGERPTSPQPPQIRSSAIEFRVPRRNEPRSARTVSATRLRHVVPKPAQKALIRGLKFLDQGENQKAHQQLIAAIAAAPDLMDAHNALGILYARTTRYGDAKLSFAKLWH